MQNESPPGISLADAPGGVEREVALVPSEYRSPVQPSYLTRAQAAEHFGVTTKTITRWVQAGKLVPIAGTGSRNLGVTLASVEALTKEGVK